MTSSCNCRPERDSCACGSDCAQRPQSLLLGRNYSKTSWEVNCHETVRLSVLMHIINSCSPLCWSDNWKYCLAVGLACVTDSNISQVLLPLLLSYTSSLSPCWDRNTEMFSQMIRFALCGTTSPALVSWQGQPRFSGNSWHSKHYHEPLRYFTWMKLSLHLNKYSCLAFMKNN